ncbi:MAG: molybdenum cofactor guanylyltransferase [Mariprofundaceae bacterium]|nr:molybdenum cofactor guanylyltransferase [Mariprofundaceae bacterium]
MTHLFSIEHCTAVILAGGESRRMGCDKAQLRLGEASLLDHALHHVRPVFPHIAVSVRQPRDDVDGVQWCDQGAGRGPMMGIAAALSQMTTPWLFVLACDMPLVSSALIRQLAEQVQQDDAVDVIVPRIHGHVQPLCGFYSVRCLPAMEARIAAGQRGVQSLIATLHARVIDWDSMPQQFMDVDTPQDMNMIESQYQGRL